MKRSLLLFSLLGIALAMPTPKSAAQITSELRQLDTSSSNAAPIELPPTDFGALDISNNTHSPEYYNADLATSRSTQNNNLLPLSNDLQVGTNYSAATPRTTPTMNAGSIRTPQLDQKPQNMGVIAALVALTFAAIGVVAWA